MGKRGYGDKETFPFVTVILAAVNILVFVVTEYQGSTLDPDYMIRMGAMYGPSFFGKHEYYRILTHFFLHFGLEHLVNNMVSLLVLGYALESEVGRGWFAFIYMFSGVFSGMVSAIGVQLAGSGEQVVSCGASGAIYGVMGALLVLLIVRQRGRLKQEIPRFLIYIFLSLYSGSQDPGIDNRAHVGGFIGGIIICIVVCVLRKAISNRKEQVV